MLDNCGADAAFAVNYRRNTLNRWSAEEYRKSSCPLTIKTIIFNCAHQCPLQTPIIRYCAFVHAYLLYWFTLHHQSTVPWLPNSNHGDCIGWSLQKVKHGIQWQPRIDCCELKGHQFVNWVHTIYRFRMCLDQNNDNVPKNLLLFFLLLHLLVLVLILPERRRIDFHIYAHSVHLKAFKCHVQW